MEAIKMVVKKTDMKTSETNWKLFASGNGNST